MDEVKKPDMSNDFLEKLGMRESSGKYDAVNDLGYIGKYQFGGLALQDLGYKDSKGKWLGKDGVNSKEDFLKNKDIQESAASKWIPMLKKRLQKTGAWDKIGTDFQGIPITADGLLAASHLVGAQGASNMLASGKVPQDAFGTKATSYLKKFANKPEKKVDIDSGIELINNNQMSKEVQSSAVEGLLAVEATKLDYTPNNAADAMKLVKHVSKKEPNMSIDDTLKSVDTFSKQKAERYEITGAPLYSPSTIGTIASTVADFVSEAPSYIFENAKKIPDIEQEDIDRFGQDFSDTMMERTLIGGAIKKGMLATETSDKIDPNYDPTKNQILFTEMTKDLSPEQIKVLLEDYSYNEQDFLKAATMLSMRKERLNRMEEYTKENPAVSAISSLSTMLVEGAFFMPIGGAVASAAAAKISGQALNSLTKAKRLGYFLGGETVEQGLYEVGANALVDDYTTHPALFLAGVSVGTGLRHVVDTVENSRVVKELLKNEDGFLLLSESNAKRLVAEVAKETDDKSKLQILKNLADGKVRKSNYIRKNLLSKFDNNSKVVDLYKKELKTLKKGTPEYKDVKNKLQKAVRISKRDEKNIINELKQVVDGTHPQLRIAFNKEFAIKEMVKDFGIDPKTLSKPEDLRKFFHVESGKFAEQLVFEGESGYEMVLKNQIKELSSNPRQNTNHFLNQVSAKMENMPLNIDSGVSGFVYNTLRTASDTDGLMTKYLLNKGNHVNSDNHYVAGLYNWLAPDAGGRVGMSAIRAHETKEIYQQTFFGEQMDNYKPRGYELLKHMYKGQGAKKIWKVFGDFHAFENEVMPIFKDRLVMSIDDFKSKYPDSTVQRIADEFTKDYNSLNKKIAKLAEKHGVVGAGADSENYIHRAWDSSKARLIPKQDLEAAVETAIRKSLLDSGLPIEESFIKEQSRNFVYGIQHKDITNNIEVTQDYLDNLYKFIKTQEAQGAEKAVIDAVESEIRHTEARKLANELKELGKRTELDLNIEIPNSNGKRLSDILEDNFIDTQNRYNSRMAARISAAEHGIKDINALDAWKRDALVAEKKRLLDSGSDHIEQRVKYLDDILSQDIKAFKYGGFGGKADTIDAEANDFIRLMKKITAVNLLRDTGIASLAEFSGTVSEVGAFNAIKPVMDSFKFSLDRAYMFKTPTERLASLTDDMTSLIGIGFEDMAFTSRGVSKSQQIYKSGMLANVEGGVDALGSVTKSTFGWIENTTRRATANALAVKWGRHFMGQEPDGVIKSFFSLNKKTTNRALENSGLGTWVDDGGQKVFKTNELYDSIKDNYMKHVKFDDKGNPVRMNFDKWMPEAKDAFRDVVKLQTSHIHVNPDSTTTALWMTTGIGQLLNQFRTFSVNAMSKVTGFAFGNLYNGIKHNDPHEVMKFVNNMFWASAMGTLSIGVRDEVKYAGTGRDDVGFNKIMDDPARAMSLGIWRSGFVGSMDMYVATGSQMLGLPDITSGSSFTRKNKKYFDLSSKPVGQLAQNAFEGASAVLQGDGEKAMDKFRKTTPFANMLGIQQMLNVIGVNDKK